MAGPQGLLARIFLGTGFVIMLLGCARRSGDTRLEEMRRGLEELAASEARALRPIDLAALGANATTDTLAPGLIHHVLRFAEGPWVAHVLDVDLRACWSPVAVKAGGGAVGRARTTELLESLLRSDATEQHSGRTSFAAGVNADFFRFNPPGVPVAAHITGGRVVAGPSRRPVLAIDGAGAPSIAFLEDSGFVVIGADSLPLSAWNRAAPEGLALFDADWGEVTDSTTGAVEMTVAIQATVAINTAARPGGPPRREALLLGKASAVDTAPAGVPIPGEQLVLVAGAAASPSLRARLLAARPGVEPVRVQRWIEQRSANAELDSLDSLRASRSVAIRGTPREAVGGFPVLVRRFVLAPDLDSAGGPGFGPVRHPRTAVGISQMGTHLLLVTVDGRQPGYSVGMTLPELARLMLDLGAAHALNLDGGGSTTMALTRGSGMTRILNQPSDTSGERPVSNALAVLRGCPTPAVDQGRNPERTP